MYLRRPGLAVGSTRGPESTKITAELSPQDLLSAFAKLGSSLVKLQTRASHAALGSCSAFRHALFVAFRVRLGHRPIPERGQWSLATPVMRWYLDAYR